MTVSVVYDVAFLRALHAVPKGDRPWVLAVRDQIAADAPNLPAIADAVFEEALPALHYARHVPLTPWVVVYDWSVAARALVFRTVSAPDPPF